MESPRQAGHAEGRDGRRRHMDQDLTLHQIVDGISGLITVTTADGEVSLVNQPVLDQAAQFIEHDRERIA